MNNKASLLALLAKHSPSNLAVRDAAGNHSYGNLLNTAFHFAKFLPYHPTRHIPARIGVLTNPNLSFLASLLSIWSASMIAVPLSPLYPKNALEKVLNDTRPQLVITDNHTAHLLPDRFEQLKVETMKQQPSAIHESDQTTKQFHTGVEEAMLIYTSGTTGHPKGVVWTHDMLQYQTSTMTKIWKWSHTDTALCVLPLHHIHGLVNVLLTAISAGACVEMHQHAFQPKKIWNRLQSRDISVFMAVPAVYTKLIHEYDRMTQQQKTQVKKNIKHVRLFVCGSAGLGKREFDKWLQISGQRMLERYGMTEAGMVLSNSYDDRRQGILGKPLPGVETNVKKIQGEEGGRLFIRGPGVFKQYWGKPEKTAEAFDEDGWMDTGDIVVEEHGAFRMLGRASTDIINTGGYMVSAVEVEEICREFQGVEECCVVGISHDVLGEIVVAAIVAKGQEVKERISAFAAEQLPRYKVPRKIVLVKELPRNVMGKVEKNKVRQLFEHNIEEPIAG